MNPTASWTVAVEGDADVAIATAILGPFGQGPHRVIVAGGKSKLDPRLQGYVSAARYAAWLILRDLDRDADCAPSLLGDLALKGPTQSLRIAVRNAEGWLLADTERAARWLGVPVTKVPRDVDALPDPKQTLLNLAANSRRREIREDVVPMGTARVGRGYVDQVRLFCRNSWRPEVAAKASDSLRRCLRYVQSRSARGA